jgi:hypothetical protein
MSRVVGIPSTIRHIAVLDSKESDNLSGKLALLKDKWMHHKEMKRAILFVPTSDDVLQVVNMLKFWGLADEVVDLQAEGGRAQHSGNDAEARIRRTLAQTQSHPLGDLLHVQSPVSASQLSTSKLGHAFLTPGQSLGPRMSKPGYRSM